MSPSATGRATHQPVAMDAADGSQTTTKGGFWAAIDVASGKVLWRPPTRNRPSTGAMSLANGVIYAGSLIGDGNNMYALNAETGAVLWTFASGGAVASGAAIVGGTVFWGSGYRGGDNDKLYAFSRRPITQRAGAQSRSRPSSRAIAGSSI